MYAIVKTGGKQYKVTPGDRINIEKIDAEVGSTVELPVICIVDGDKVEADPAKAAETKVTATILEQFKGEKQIVFKFKRRKNYKRMHGHRQQLSRIRIESVGSEKAEPLKELSNSDDQDDVTQYDDISDAQEEEITETLNDEATESQNNETTETDENEVTESQDDESVEASDGETIDSQEEETAETLNDEVAELRDDDLSEE